ncbi:MAG TPA: hypothetical protein DER09_12275 [Prolixibacteraceae bacterium]|nr:hypothetical protein [Prolixibacteraceae bacterium]
MKGSSIFYLVVFVLLFAACKPTDEEKARIRLNNAKFLLEKGDTVNAMLQLDSISLYPEAKYSANAAKNLAAEINFSLLQKKEVELDTLEAKIARLETSFDKEKTEYDRYVQYIHKKQNQQNALGRSFIKVHLDERGTLYLSSNYFGKSLLNHYALRIYDGDISAKTDSVPVGSPENHQSDFLDYKWEKVLYSGGKDNGVTEFIAANTDRNLKAVFIGRQQQFIVLATWDKDAVREALALSTLMKQKAALQKEIQVLQKKVPVQ